jgi:hypothetical protein
MCERNVPVCVEAISSRGQHRRVVRETVGRYRLEELVGEQEDPGPDGGPMDWTTVLVLSDALVATRAMESRDGRYNVCAKQSPDGTYDGYRWRILTVNDTRLAARILETAVW